MAEELTYEETKELEIKQGQRKTLYSIISVLLIIINLAYMVNSSNQFSLLGYGIVLLVGIVTIVIIHLALLEFTESDGISAGLVCLILIIMSVFLFNRAITVTTMADTLKSIDGKVYGREACSSRSCEPISFRYWDFFWPGSPPVLNVPIDWEKRYEFTYEIEPKESLGSKLVTVLKNENEETMVTCRYTMDVTINAKSSELTDEQLIDVETLLTDRWNPIFEEYVKGLDSLDVLKEEHPLYHPTKVQALLLDQDLFQPTENKTPYLQERVLTLSCFEKSSS